MPVWSLWRQNRMILLEAEWIIQNRCYYYREESQKNCYLDIPVTVPEAVIHTVIGRNLGEIAQGYGALENAKIARIDSSVYQSRIYLNQGWIPVDAIKT